jgi:hypothetical protein
MTTLLEVAKQVVQEYRSFESDGMPKELRDDHIPEKLVKAIENLSRFTTFHEKFSEVKELLRQAEAQLMELDIPPTTELRVLLERARGAADREILAVDLGSSGALLRVR